MGERHPEIVEFFLCSKSGDSNGGEDGLYLGDRYIAVVDGATSKSEWYRECSEKKHPLEAPGLLAKRAILKALSEAPSLENPYALLCCLDEAVARVATVPSEHPQASVAVYACDASEVWLYGDCQCLIDGELHVRRKKADLHLAEKRARVIQQLLDGGMTIEQILEDDKGRDAILQELRSDSLLANSSVPGGYPVLNGSGIVRDFLDVIPVPPKGQVVLATDGYPVLFDTLAESEDYLSRIIESDPLMAFKYPSTKGVYTGQVSYDDRAYVRFDVGESDET